MFRLFCCFDPEEIEDVPGEIHSPTRSSNRTNIYRGSFAQQDQPIYAEANTPNIFHLFEEDPQQYTDTISNPNGTRGIRTRIDIDEIPPNTYVGEYTGDEIKKAQKELRIRNGQGGCIIALGSHENQPDVPLWIDGRNDDSNMLRLINNSCDDDKINIYYRKVLKNSLNNTGGIACIQAYTLKAIPPDTPVYIRFNHQMMNEVVPPQYRIHCFCQGFTGEGKDRHPICTTLMT
jgi:hypothetical protein